MQKRPFCRLVVSLAGPDLRAFRRLCMVLAISLILLPQNCATSRFGRTSAVDLPELIDSPLAVPLPAIEDPTGSLAPFYRKAAALLRGTRKTPLRIAFYGDSNMTSDYISGEMRRTLQAMYGDPGHGYVALGRPWSWYKHMDVRHDVDQNGWISYTVTTEPAPDGYYGFAGISAQSKFPGVVTWVETAADDSPVGKRAGLVEVHYLNYPGNGTFKILLNGKEWQEVDTNDDHVSAGVKRFALPEDGPARLEFKAGERPVRLFGAALERDAPGFIVDSLGVGAHNCMFMLTQDRAVMEQALKNRGYDLIIFLTGTNMWNAEMHPVWMREVIARHRAALPDAPILLMSPPDWVETADNPVSHERMIQCGLEKRQIALDNGTAFWDFWNAMGGNGSAYRFYCNGFCQWDLVHLTRTGGAFMGRRLTRALWTGLRDYMAKNPDAGRE
ncbi:MAG: hypothetical protein EPN93_21055 [Spirochaetes bacterium]|nr:MAG: hypothetical protein EPN93_21055 [Spirochaetota bacterium]